jgi:RNA polymerase sigma-70 factor (sigma-E family)
MCADHASENFITFVQLTRNWLHRQAYRLCGDWHEAEDLVQLTLLKMYRQWEGLTEPDRLNVYTRQVLLRTFLSERRRQRWECEVICAELPNHSGGATRSSDDRITLAWAVDQLASRQRAVVTLRFLEDLSVQQTATALGCSVGTVASQTHRALRNLRAALATAYDGTSGVTGYAGNPP